MGIGKHIVKEIKYLLYCVRPRFFSARRTNEFQNLELSFFLRSSFFSIPSPALCIS